MWVFERYQHRRTTEKEGVCERMCEGDTEIKREGERGKVREREEM